MNLRTTLQIVLLAAIAFQFPLEVTGQTCSELRYIDPLFDVETTSNVEYQQARAYGSLLNQAYTMDIYTPIGDTMTYRPLMVFQFGGGFLIGDKLLPPAPDYCTYWAERGYVAVSIDYRLGFSATSEESAERAVYRAVQDLQAALRYLSEFRNDYGIDTGNIIVSGNSAGAFTTLHSTFMDEYQAPASHSGVGIGLDSDDLGGIYESGNNYWNNEEVNVHGIIANWGAILDTNFIGDAPDDLVPTILFHGTDDNAVPYETGQPFSSPFFPNVYGSYPIAARLSNTTIPYKFVPLIGAGHEPELLNTAYLDTILWESEFFMYHHVLKPEIQSVNGLTGPLLNSTATYTVIANEPIIQVCATANNGTVVSSNLNQVEIQWTTAGQDTLQIIAGNDILAYDTAYVPIEVISLTGLEELRPQKLATIQPNVFSDQTLIQFSKEPTEETTLVVTNTLGQTVYEEFIVSDQITVTAKELGKGFYWVYLKKPNGQRQFIDRLVVQ